MSDSRSASSSRILHFRRVILDWYRTNGRHTLPWRKTQDPYKILVSEVMLQQTQIPRVLEKYREFLRVFPTVRVLAVAPARNVLRIWQGLGYNRRALYLQRAAQQIVSAYKGRFPQSVHELEILPGIGPYTARAVAVFAWNEPEVLLETNIRRVMLHFFFPDQDRVPDSLVESLLKTVLDTSDPRVWYWALMDYGAGPLKKIPNPNRRSKHYVKQSKFEGSRRYVRAQVLSILLNRRRGLGVDALDCALKKDPHCKAYLKKNNLKSILAALAKERLIVAGANRYSAPDF